jgi:hypothetical protein
MTMAECIECGKQVSFMQIRAGELCLNCFEGKYGKYGLQTADPEQQRIDAAKRRLADQEIGSMLVTTAHTLQGIEVTKYLGVISAECAYGMNMFKDMFARSVDRSCYRVSLG